MLLFIISIFTKALFLMIVGAAGVVLFGRYGSLPFMVLFEDYTGYENRKTRQIICNTLMITGGLLALFFLKPVYAQISTHEISVFLSPSKDIPFLFGILFSLLGSALTILWGNYNKTARYFVGLFS